MNNTNEVKAIWSGVSERARAVIIIITLVTLIDVGVVALFKPPVNMLLVLMGLIWVMPLVVALSVVLFLPPPKPLPQQEER